jgi:hypothetical protein
MPERLDRRELLAAVAGTGVLLLAAPLDAWGWRATPGYARGDVLTKLAASPGVRLVGEEYLRARPEEAGAARLRRAVGSLPDLAGTIRDDFRHARIFRVEGWALSLTEARLCALALVTGRSGSLRHPGRT